MFHSKEVTFSGRSLHRGWHRKVLLVSRCFSGKVKLASHASRKYKHGEDELIYDIIKRLIVRQKKTLWIYPKRVDIGPGGKQTGGNPACSILNTNAATTFAARQSLLADWGCYAGISPLIG